MDMLTVFLLVLGAFFAANMGISGFSVAFTPSFGSRLIKHRTAVILYTLTVMTGASILGPRVAETLMKKLAAAPPTLESGIMILAASGFMMFLATWLKVPQSTSFVTVAAFTGAGIYRGTVNWSVVSRIFIVALVFCALSYFITLWIYRYAYPPRRSNLWLHEMLSAKKEGFQRFIIGHDLFAGFSVGTNNVANVVAALAGVGMGVSPQAFVAYSLCFGLGALVAGERVIKVVAREIIPVGDFAASVISLLTASFVLTASFLGLPTPYAQITTFSVLGISSVKDGIRVTFGKAVVQKILYVWLAVPLATCALSYALHSVFLKGKVL
jgi:PiT family inorganic phosphate transporter